MPRTVSAILIEAEEWQSVVEFVLALNREIGALGDDASAACTNALAAIARGDIAGVVEAQASALQGILERVAVMQPDVLHIVKVAADRVTTLRVEAAELRNELDT